MVKYLTSLVSNSRQPARRPPAAGLAPQSEGFNPPNPMQESPPLQPNEQHSRIQHSVQRDAAASITVPPRPSPWDVTETGTETGISAVETSKGVVQHEMPEGPRAPQLSPATPEVHPSSATQQVPQPRVVESQERENIPQAAGKPAAPVGQPGVEPGVAVPQRPVVGQTDESVPGTTEIPSPGEGADAVAPHAPIVSEVPQTQLTGLPADSSEEPVRDQSRLADSTPSFAVQPEGLERSMVNGRLQDQRQTQEPVSPVQATVQQEPGVPHNPIPRQPVSQNQARDIPQVRIGQINVLVEDQTPAKPSPRKSATRSAAANPFGLRGL